MTSFFHFHLSKAKVLDVILHGASSGIISPFMLKIFKVSINKGHSAIMFNFPYFERGENHSSGPKLKEELKTLKMALNIAKFKRFKHIRLIGKSLGGIVASYYLNSLNPEEQKKYEVIILGYVTGEVKLKDFNGKVTIIQGEKDKFGNVKAVKKDLKGALSKNIAYYEIKSADHSFREPETKKPKYEHKVIKILNYC